MKNLITIKKFIHYYKKWIFLETMILHVLKRLSENVKNRPLILSIGQFYVSFQLNNFDSVNGVYLFISGRFKSKETDFRMSNSIINNLTSTN